MKKALSIFTAVMLAAACLFANGQKEASAAQGSGETTITFWAFPIFFQNAGDPAGTYEQKLIQTFEAQNPGIKVKLETIDFKNGPDKIVASIEGGTAPDVLFDAPGRIIDYGKKGKLVNLNDLFTDSAIKDFGNPALTAACSDGKNYYMYPISASPFYMGLNKELWEKVGALKYVNLEGDRTWTTANFIKAMECFKGSGIPALSVYCGGQGGDQGTRALVSNLYGAHIADATCTKYTMDSAEAVKALKLLKSLVDSHAIDAGMDIAAADELQLFAQQKIASTICWGTSNAKNYATKDFTAISVPFPSDDGVPELEYLINGFCVFNNNNTAKAAAAKKFVQFLCSDTQNVIQTGAFPVRTSMGNLYSNKKLASDAIGLDMDLLAKFTKYYGTYYNTMNGFANMRTEWWNMLQYIFSGAKTAETASADCAKAANAGIK